MMAPLLSALWAACGGPSLEEKTVDAATGGASEPVVRDLFSDVTAAAGLEFAHFNGMSGELYFSEMMGAGAALFDYDRDGDLDLYLVQGELLGADKTMDDALFPPAPGTPAGDRLLRNDLGAPGAGGSPELRFTDVTAESGIDGAGYGMGAAAGDFDNDGWVDLYVTNMWSSAGRRIASQEDRFFSGEHEELRDDYLRHARGNSVFLNNGDGTFRDVTEGSGAMNGGWAWGAVSFDLNNDGRTDFYSPNGFLTGSDPEDL